MLGACGHRERAPGDLEGLDGPDDGERAPRGVVALRNADRLKFFTDAVVAIAMTLLILPLLESVSEAGAKGLGTADYLHEHSGLLLAFLLSFVIIATFWVSHERLY